MLWCSVLALLEKPGRVVLVFRCCRRADAVVVFLLPQDDAILDAVPTGPDRQYDCLEKNREVAK